MKKFLALMLVAVLALSLMACGQNTEVEEPATEVESDLAYVTEKGELIIGMTLFAPMDYMDENGELTGFEVEFGKAVCEKLGLTPNFIEINWDAKETELNSKNIDCIWNGMTITEERKTNMSVSVPYLGNKQVMVAKADKADAYVTDVTGAKVVAELGSAGEELALENEFFAAAEFTGVDSMAKALMEVKAGTADIAIVDYVTSIGSIGEGTDYADFVVVEAEDFAAEEYGIAFRKGSDLCEKVNEVIAELTADGTLKAIAEKYKLADLLIAE
ncbi:MAG: transporter substrate-binding domain-containing protein [Clostridia bacterium]|nr:transporter substrate-binding domain-containing protein [Clostridia bacterium]